MRGSVLRRLIAVGWAALGCLAAAVAAPALAHAQGNGCREVAVPVSGLVAVSVPVVAPRMFMHGSYCRARGRSRHAVQVLVPGSTYTRVYWGFPYRPDIYDFRLAMNRAGFDTLVVDRLGSGSSSRPPSALLSATAQASAVHQVIQALRRGELGAGAGDKVILGGHSLGSLIIALEASIYHDVDAVLLTGVSHHLNQTVLAKLVATGVRPAALDPALRHRGYDPGYLTTVPGARAEFFYSPGTADPGVAETDERTKDVLAVTEAPDGIGAISIPESRAIDVPVMLADGGGDKLSCGVGANCTSSAGLKASEQPYFSRSARLHTFVLPGFGHDINLAPNTREYQRAVVDWASALVSRDRG